MDGTVDSGSWLEPGALDLALKENEQIRKDEFKIMKFLNQNF